MELPGTMPVEVAHHRLLRLFFSSWNYNPEAEIWQQMADNLTTVAVAESGHLPHKERPDAVNEALFEFLKAGMAEHESSAETACAADSLC